MPAEGWLRIVGLGPGPAEWLTPEASGAVEAASHVLGYYSYVTRLEQIPGRVVLGSDNGDELTRAREGLELAASGARVAVVSGGDPGVFGMAAAVFEAIESGPAHWRSLDVGVVPGVTAMLAAAARLGAPLGNDFCAISLSNNLKPWSVIEKRLELAARADFVLALYNPASQARSELVFRAFEVLRQHRPPNAIVAFARAAGRKDEDVLITTLDQADPGRADMRTLILVGAESTRRIERPSRTPWIYTPRWLPAEAS